MKPALVTGGSGTLGRNVADRLLHAGCAVRVVSRRARAIEGATPYAVDLRTGEGLDAAAEGVSTVIHLATTHRRDGDVVSTRNLIAAARRASVSHLVYISITGVDRVSLGLDPAVQRASPARPSAPWVWH